MSFGLLRYGSRDMSVDRCSCSKDWSAKIKVYPARRLHTNYKNTASTPSPFPVIWIAACKSTLEARWAQLWSRQLRQKFALRHSNVCSCFCAHLSTPTWTLLPSLWSTGNSIPSGYPAARICPAWSLQHSSDCQASIPHPPISKLPSRSSKIHITVNQEGFAAVIWGSLLSSRTIPLSKRQPFMFYSLLLLTVSSGEWC